MSVEVIDMKMPVMRALVPLLLLGLMSGPAVAQKLYKWVDENGQVHYGDKVPPEYANQDRDVLNKRGMAIGHEEGTETPADRIPPIFGAAGLTWDARTDLSLEAYLMYAGSQDRYSPRDEIDPRIEPGGTAGWVTWNLRGAWQVSDAFSASVRLANLGDRRYREFGSGLDAPGFDCLVTLDYEF